jgi:hypothetical protein
MSACHGANPFDVQWKTVWSIAVPRVPMKAVDAFLRDATPDGALLHHAIPNKGFRVVQQAGDCVVALYNHDGQYSLITANTAVFEDTDYRQHAAMKNYQRPGKRLPYLVIP